MINTELFICVVPLCSSVPEHRFSRIETVVSYMRETILKFNIAEQKYFLSPTFTVDSMQLSFCLFINKLFLPITDFSASILFALPKYRIIHLSLLTPNDLSISVCVLRT